MSAANVYEDWRTIALTSSLLAALYIALYQLNVLIMGTEAFSGVASVLFLPAFVRLLGFLLVGLWVVPTLFVAAWWCVDLGLDPTSQIIVAFSLSIGSPIALWVARRLVDIQPKLENLNGIHLLVLSIAAALGNGTAYHLGLSVVGAEPQSINSFMVTALGDAVGTWAIIYSLKTLLIFIGRLISLSRD